MDNLWGFDKRCSGNPGEFNFFCSCVNHIDPQNKIWMNQEEQYEGQGTGLTALPLST